MSGWVVSETDIDAFVTVGLRWTQHPPAGRPPLVRVTEEQATDVGTRLWRANHDAFNYGGDRNLVDPEVRREVDGSGDVVVMPGYQFRELPGMPRPETALKLAEYYRYQTANDDWDGSFEETYMSWVLETATSQLDGRDPTGMLAYTGVPWGLENKDRDLFIQLA